MLSAFSLVYGCLQQKCLPPAFGIDQVHMSAKRQTTRAKDPLSKIFGAVVGVVATSPLTMCIYYRLTTAPKILRIWRGRAPVYKLPRIPIYLELIPPLFLIFAMVLSLPE